MTTQFYAFRIDILDVSGNSIDVDPLLNITSLSDTRRLNQIGDLTFTMPASDHRTAEITAGRQFHVYDALDGDLGIFLFRRKTITDDSQGNAILRVECWDSLHELTRYIAGFNRNYSVQDVETIINDLVGDVSGWTATFDISPAQNASIDYQGQKLFDAIEELAIWKGLHFRLAPTRVLEFGAFGTLNSDVRLTNLPATIAIDQHTITEIVLIDQITETIEDEELVTRLIALGPGEGAGQITLQDADDSIYTIQLRTRPNGREEYYIQDDDAIEEFGEREDIVIFEEIHPNENSLAGISRAKNELSIAASQYLLRYSLPQISYDIGISGLRVDLQPGDKVPMRYMGITSNFKYIDVDSEFWVMDITRNRTATGERSADLTITNTDVRQTTDRELLGNMARTIKRSHLRIAPVAFRMSDTYTDTIQHGDGVYTDKLAEFRITIDSTITDLTIVKLLWTTKPLTSTTAWVDGVGGQDGFFVAMEGDDYPVDISMEINGVNVDNHVDIVYGGGNGPWNSGGTPNAALNISMDITEYMENAPGGIFQLWIIKLIPNASYIRTTTTPAHSTNAVNGPGNHGIVEMQVIIQGSATALYRS